MALDFQYSLAGIDILARKHFVVHRTMNVGPDIAAAAALIGDPARAAMISVLLGGEAYPASVLAARAGISAQTASMHLAKLQSAAMVKVAKSGRYRFYRLGSARIAEAFEALAAISQPHPIRSMHQSDAAKALNHARMCYDHLAGRIGVGIADQLLLRRLVTSHDSAFAVTKRGATWLEKFDIDLASLTTSRRKLATACLDWSERRPHVGGALGAAIAQRTLELGWFARHRVDRGLTVTAAGVKAILSTFDIDARTVAEN